MGHPCQLVFLRRLCSSLPHDPRTRNGNADFPGLDGVIRAWLQVPRTILVTSSPSLFSSAREPKQAQHRDEHKPREGRPPPGIAAAGGSPLSELDRGGPYSTAEAFYARNWVLRTAGDGNCSSSFALRLESAAVVAYSPKRTIPGMNCSPVSVFISVVRRVGQIWVCCTQAMGYGALAMARRRGDPARLPELGRDRGDEYRPSDLYWAARIKSLHTPSLGQICATEPGSDDIGQIGENKIWVVDLNLVDSDVYRFAVGRI